MKTIRWTISVTALVAMTAQSWAAVPCDASAAAALKTAAVQQELMVAGLTCNDTSAYNRFVLAFQPDLQKSDAALKTYFRNRDGNEAGYDSYKTKLANLAAGKSAADTARFCASANRAFTAAAAKNLTLEDFIQADRPQVAVAEVCAIPHDTVEVAVAGVPSHQMPAMPYGDAANGPAPSPSFTAPLPARPPIADPDRRQAYNDLPRPPRYPREETYADAAYGYGASPYQAPAYGRPSYGSPSYGPPSYGPPAYGASAYDPAWAPRPRRWSRGYYDD